VLGGGVWQKPGRLLKSKKRKQRIGLPELLIKTI